MQSFRKANISFHLIRSCQGVRNVSFSESFAYVLNGWSLIKTHYERGFDFLPQCFDCDTEERCGTLLFQMVPYILNPFMPDAVII